MFLHCALLCSKNLGVPSRRCTVPSRRENKNVPSRAVEKKKYRLFPSSKKKKTPCRPVLKIILYEVRTILSRRAKNYIPSRPVVTIFIYRSVPSWNKKVIVLYRSVPSGKFTPTVPSRLLQASLIFIILPSRPVPSSFFFPPNMSKQYRPVPSRVLQAMNCLENCNTLVNMIGTMGLWA